VAPQGVGPARALIFNAELVRNLRSGLRARRAIALVVLVVIACFINIALNVSAQADYTGGRFRLDADRIATAARIAFFVTFAVQILVVCLHGVNQAAGSIVGERENRTWGLQRLTPASEFQLAWGKLLGAPAAAWLIVAVSIPAQVICVCAGGVGFAVFVKSTLLVVACGLMAAALGLVFSGASEQRRSATGGSILILIAIFIFTPAFARVPEGWLLAGLNPWVAFAKLIREADPDARIDISPVPFFGMELDFVWMSILIEALAATAFVLGAMRVIRDRLATVWSKTQGLVIVAVVEFFLMAGLWVSASQWWRPVDSVMTVLFASAALVLIMIIIITPGYAHARSRLRRSVLEPPGPFERVMGDRAPVTVTLLLMWAMASIAIVSVTGTALAGRALASCAIMMLALLVAEALVGICELAMPKYGRGIGVLVLVVGMSVPPIGAALAGNETGAFILCAPALAVLFLQDSSGDVSVTTAAVGGFVLWGFAALGLHALYAMQRANLVKIMKKLSAR